MTTPPTPEAPVTVYTSEQVDAQNQNLQTQIDKLTPPDPAQRAALWGAADLSAFTGVPVNAHRTYFGLSGMFNPAMMTAALAADAKAGRWSYVSIGPGHDVPTYPATLGPNAQAYVAPLGANPGKTVLLGRHEPGNQENPIGTPAQFAVWQNMILDFYKKAVPSLLGGVCMMAWTLRNAPGDAAPYMPASLSLVDQFCVDGYAHDDTTTAASIFTNALTYARSIDKPLMICEHGQELWLDQVKYLASVDAFLQANPDVLGALYWNGGAAANAAQGHNYHLQPAALTHFAQMLDQQPYSNLRALPAA